MTIQAMRDALASGSTSSVALVQAALQRVEELKNLLHL
jgi:Asp-tRNA(Asn)/Glu-tRNA(Gln) amidotransferase A subunit family amidase